LQIIHNDYDCVLVATGRLADTNALGLHNLNVSPSSNGKLNVDKFSLVNGTSSVFAIGDVVDGRMELTPTAVLEGKLLAGRLLNMHSEIIDYN